MPISKPAVVVYTQDLFFNIRIQDVVEQLGGQVLAVQSAADLADGLGQVPVLAVIEIGQGGEGDWIHAVAYARKWTRGIPIVAFVSHVDSAGREAAKAVGCDYVWSKSRFTNEFPALAKAYLNPSERPSGCDDLPNDLMREGLALFNEGEFYKCHDALEAAWVAEQRPCRDLYQGILQFAIALHHIEQGNYNGADKMFRRAINKFQRLPDSCRDIDVAWLLSSSRDLHHLLIKLGPAQIETYPRERFLTISYTRAAQENSIPGTHHNFVND